MSNYAKSKVQLILVSKLEVSIKYLRIDIFCVLVHQELPGGYGRVKPDVVTYGSGVRGSSLKYVRIF